MTINQELVQKRCEEITESVERLKELKKISLGEFVSNRDLQDIGCYRLLVAIEAALNICYHISAKKLKKVPREYAECFGILGENGIITLALSKKLQKMARFRNMLVHMYWKMDLEIIYDIIQKDLNHLIKFSESIVTLL